MEIVHYLAIVRRRLWLIVLCMLLAGAGAYGISLRISPRYDATATMLLRPSSPDREYSYDTLLAVQQMGQTYAPMMIQEPVLSSVIKSLDLDATVDSLAKRVRADALPNTSLIRITASDGNSQRAAAIANEVAKVFIRQYQERNQQYYSNSFARLDEELKSVEGRITTLLAHIDNLRDVESTSDLEVELAAQRRSGSALSENIAQLQLRAAQLSNDILVVEQARASETPSSPRPYLNLAVGAFAGLAIALAAVFLTEFSRQLRLPTERRLVL